MIDVVIGWLCNWHMRNRTRRELSWLDDRLLVDLGIERSNIEEVANFHLQAAKEECRGTSLGALKEQQLRWVDSADTGQTRHFGR
jgi:uncharacterized protein YjiS (DUF1127 family)